MPSSPELSSYCPVCRARVEIRGVLVTDDGEDWTGAIFASHFFGGGDWGAQVVDSRRNGLRGADGKDADGEVFLITCPGSQARIERRFQ